jgi:hypothetical protein
MTLQKGRGLFLQIIALQPFQCIYPFYGVYNLEGRDWAQLSRPDRSLMGP